MSVLILDILKLCFEIAELIGRIAFAFFGVVVIYFLSCDVLPKLFKRKK